MNDRMLLNYGARFLLGGCIVVAATYLSQIDRPVLSGTAILFPGITLTSYFLIGHTQDLAAVRAAIPASLYAIAGYFVLLPVMYVSSTHTGLVPTLALSFLAWLLAVSAMLTLLPVQL